MNLKYNLQPHIVVIMIVLLLVINLVFYSTNDDPVPHEEAGKKSKRSTQIAQQNQPFRQPQFQDQRQPPLQPPAHQVSNFHQQVRWFPPTSPSGLREPVNVPTMINQADANYLERYMKNSLVDGDNTNQTPLDLGSINDRATRLDSRSSGQLEARANPQIQPSARYLPIQQQQTQLSRPHSLWETPIQTQTRMDGPLIKKGKVDDVLLFHNNKPPGQAHPLSPGQQVAKSMDHKQRLLRDKWTENCITRATPMASRCEDHLIKRLYQDAAEGRTVLDVGRRVCCALFWHKDCISRIVVETCPDSSPIAADYLMGSRKLDLTLSCQKFNRDGCNGSLSSFRPSNHLSLVVVVIVAYVVIKVFI